MSENAVGTSGSFLNGLRVIEFADELGEHCGKVLAGFGADVIKVEPPGGEKTRGYGPFHNDQPHPTAACISGIIISESAASCSTRGRANT